VFLITPDLDTLYAICNRIAVLADKHVLINAPIEQVERFDHPWVQEYFHGPRGRAAQRSLQANESASIADNEPGNEPGNTQRAGPPAQEH
jgi:phospholipid/cholesterol/gamma-HCH transport system ATP-binding protein